MLFRNFLMLAVSPSLAFASVDRLYVIERTDVLAKKNFGAAGPYERLVLKARLQVDPNLPQNKIVSDIALAPRNANGLVEWETDVYVIKPLDPARGNGTVLLEINNRGNKGMVGMFDFAPSSLDPQKPGDFGDAYLLEQGYTLAWVGWQWDVPQDAGKMRVYPPAVKGVTGTVRAEFVPDSKVTSFLVSDRGHMAYPATEPNDPKMQLTVRDRADGPRKVIPRTRWRFSDPTHVEMAAGFDAGKLYDVTYKAADPVLVGLGPAAVRDVISFLKFGGNTMSALGDQSQHIKRAIGFGTSQSGRFLRTFLYYGFNEDEKGRKVFDGVWAHVGGAGRGSFNHRFAQPSRDGHPFFNTQYPSDLFPFTDLDETDADTGITDGLLRKAIASKAAPKIFYTNGSYEYWGRAASLIHTAPDGKSDAKLPDTTRAYFLAGTQHGPGSFPSRKADTTLTASNPNDYRFMMRALLASMNDWVKDAKQPPPSQYPQISKDQLVSAGALQFPKIPGSKLPKGPGSAWHLDFGPKFRTEGIVTQDPPKPGKAFPVLVPQVNMDGNETSGIRLPDLVAPLATYTGWNLRDPKIGAPDEIFSMVGGFYPFAKTKAERESRKDPRPSIEERYSGKADYIAKYEGAARDLVKSGYVLEADLPRLMENASKRWDALAK